MYIQDGHKGGIIPEDDHHRVLSRIRQYLQLRRFGPFDPVQRRKMISYQHDGCVLLQCQNGCRLQNIKNRFPGNGGGTGLYKRKDPRQ